MRKLCLPFALAAIVATPAAAQPQVQAQQPPAAEQQKKTKQVCELVAAERSTGSRLSSTTRVCRTVEVPMEDVRAKDAGAGSGNTDRAPHTH